MSEKKYPKPFTLVLPENIYQSVKHLSEKKDFSMARIIRQILSDHFRIQGNRYEQIKTSKE